MNTLPSFLRLLVGASLFAVAAQSAQFKALLVTKTDGWHHDSGSAGVVALQELAQLHDFEIFWSNDMGRVMNDKWLADYDVVIFLLTTGDILNKEQQGALERFVQSGKGFVGIHSAADTEYEWDWYTKMVGHMFHIHPAVQTASLEVMDPNFPGMDRFAKRFIFTDEWYEFDAPRSKNLRYLLELDSDTFEPAANWGSKKSQDGIEFRPVAWAHEYDGGRAFYTALGHMASTYKDADFLHHVYGGIFWAAKGREFRAE
ncbi:MAG: ThuA domain-containing protein [Synoicihabitans sp.]